MSPLVQFYMTIWAPLAIGLVIGVIVLSYQIEQRSPNLTNRTGVPRFAMLFHTITNFNVARDPGTQKLRRIMLGLLAGIVLLFVLVGFAISTIEQGTG